MADLGVRGLALFIGVTGLAFGGCGKEQGSAAPQTGSAGVSGSAGSGGSTGSAGSAGSAGAPTSGNGSVAGGGMGGSGGSGGHAGAGGSITSGGGAGSGNQAGAAGASEDSGGAPPATDCKPGTGFVGQLTGPGSPVPNGGIFTTDPSSVDYGDANLAGVIAAYPTSDEVHAINVDVHDVVVTATAGATPGPGISASRTDFWIADKNAVLKVALNPSLGPDCCPGFDVRSGMRISFKATEVSIFIKLGQITAASNFAAGAQGSCVLVTEPAKITDVDFYQMVRVSAKLTTDPAGSGATFTSWHLGLSDAILYDFMSANPNLQKGQTVTFVGPVSPYVGYHMLVESNHDWVKVQN